MRQTHGKPASPWVPAHQAYSSGSLHQIHQRLNNVTGINLWDDALGVPKPGFAVMARGMHRDLPAPARPSRIKPLAARESAPEAIAPLRSGNWGNDARGIERGGHYQPASGVVATPSLGSPVSRHELGHWKQHRLSSVGTPSANVQLAAPSLSNWMALRRFDPSMAGRIAGNARYATEFQGHLMATGGHGAGARRLMQATDPSNIPEWSRVRAPLQDLSDRMATHSVTANRPQLRSSVEHLVRNYGMPVKSAALGAIGRFAGRHLKTPTAGIAGIGTAATLPVWGPRLFDASGKPKPDPVTTPNPFTIWIPTGIAGARG